MLNDISAKAFEHYHQVLHFSSCHTSCECISSRTVGLSLRTTGLLSSHQCLHHRLYQQRSGSRSHQRIEFLLRTSCLIDQCFFTVHRQVTSTHRKDKTRRTSHWLDTTDIISNEVRHRTAN